MIIAKNGSYRLTHKNKGYDFQEGGILRRNAQFKYGENNLEIVNKFTYLDWWCIPRSSTGTVWTSS